MDYEDKTNGDNSSIYENDVDNEENDIDSHCAVNNVDDAIVISSEEEFDDMLITSINLTLSKTEKFKDGKVQSVSRTASIGYSTVVFIKMTLTMKKMTLIHIVPLTM